MVGNIVQGNRLASAQGRDMGVIDEDSDSARKVWIFGILKYLILTKDKIYSIYRGYEGKIFFTWRSKNQF